jgi:hypothetical protein
LGIQTKITLSCDYAGCKQSVSWVKEDVEGGGAVLPQEAMYSVIFSQGGATKTFCGQYHAAMYFMPPGYDVKKKKVESIDRKPTEDVIELCPENGQCECGHPWSDHNKQAGCIFEHEPSEFCYCDKKGPIDE